MTSESEGETRLRSFLENASDADLDILVSEAARAADAQFSATLASGNRAIQISNLNGVLLTFFAGAALSAKLDSTSIKAVLFSSFLLILSTFFLIIAARAGRRAYFPGWDPITLIDDDPSYGRSPPNVKKNLVWKSHFKLKIIRASEEKSARLGQIGLFLSISAPAISAFFLFLSVTDNNVSTYLDIIKIKVMQDIEFEHIIDGT